MGRVSLEAVAAGSGLASALPAPCAWEQEVRCILSLVIDPSVEDRYGRFR